MALFPWKEVGSHMLWYSGLSAWASLLAGLGRSYEVSGTELELTVYKANTFTLVFSKHNCIINLHNSAQNLHTSQYHFYFSLQVIFQYLFLIRMFMIIFSFQINIHGLK